MPDTDDEIFADLNSLPLELLDAGNLPIPADSLSVEVASADYKDMPTIQGPENRATFKHEMESYDAYLGVLHSSFRFATNIASVTKLVSSALTVHRQRRASLEHALKINPNNQGPVVEYDVMGNPIKR